MNYHKARWENAVRVAEKINDYIDKGYLVIDESGYIVRHKFTITNCSIKRLTSGLSPITYFVDMPGDYGAERKISKYNKFFSKWKIVDPGHIKKIKF